MASYVLLTLLLVNAVWGNPLAKQEIAKPRADKIDYRLPTTVKPILYDISIAPNFETETFQGNTTITISASESVKNITLHYRDLTGFDVAVLMDGKNNITEVVTTNETTQFLEIKLKVPLLIETNYTIVFSNITGKLNKDLDGFYLASFQDAEGKSRKFATTQFEPTGARRTFPCFDEPAMKAVFNINITKPNNSYVAVANTAIEKSEGNTVIFKQTPRMSTYLIAFIVSEMKLSERLGLNRVLAKPQDIESGKHKYSLNMGDKVLGKLGEYLAKPYTLSKMDQAAIPDEFFSAGAMENWGLVTYKETALLYSNINTTASTKQSIASVIAHEFGHQWFGNLVSPEWWQYVWLSEGFATYFGSAAVDMVDPSMELMQQFVIGAVHGALYVDSLNTTRPMNMDAGSPAEISRLFDDIVYDKAGSVIRMMEGFLTTPVFKRGLQTYIKDMASVGVARPRDLYKSIQTVVDSSIIQLLPPGTTVAYVMQSWDSVPGYPVVSVIRHYETVTDNVYVNQSRFHLKNSEGEVGKWRIPINFVSANYPAFNSTFPNLWLIGKERNYTVPYVKDTDWIIANKRQTGFYRVNYDLNNWHLIHDALIEDHTQIDVLNRAQIIDDSFNLARSGRLDYEISMIISMYLKSETNYIPFQPFFNAISFLDNMLYYSTTRDQFKSYVLLVLEDIYEHLGFDQKDTDKHTDTINRGNVLNWVCRLGHTDCRSKSLEMFSAWNNSGTPIPINITSAVLCGAMRTGTQEDHTFLYDKLKTLSIDDRHFRTWIVSALGCSENPEIIKRYLESSIADNSSLKPDDVIKSVYQGGDIGLQGSLNFLESNFTQIKEKASNINTIVSGIGTLISTQLQYDQLKNVSTHAPDIFTSALSMAKENIDWTVKNRDSIGLALTKAGVSVETGGVSNTCVNIMLLICTYLIGAMLH